MDAQIGIIPFARRLLEGLSAIGEEKMEVNRAIHGLQGQLLPIL
jgi:hypothetical protein